MTILLIAILAVVPLLAIIIGIIIYELRKQSNAHELEMTRAKAPAKTEIKD